MNVLILAGFFMVAANWAFAETVTLVSGKMVEGKIMERTDDYLKIDMGGNMAITYYLDEIDSIDGEKINMRSAQVFPSAEKVPHEVSPDQVQADQEAEKAKQYYKMGAQYAKSGDWQKALEFYKQAHQIAPDEYMINLAIGTIYFQNNNPREAIGYLEKAAQRKPEVTAPNIAAGVCSMVLGDFNKAISYFEIVKNLEPDNPTPYREMGTSYFRMNNMDKAKENFVMARDLFKKQGMIGKAEEMEVNIKRIR